MPYSQVKVYSDGGHFIGVPYEPNPCAKNRRPRCEEIIEVQMPDEQETQVVFDKGSVALEQYLSDVHEKSAPPAVKQ